MPKPPEASTFRRALLRWYRDAARELPWRQTSDPYAILVSELMLQQTQVATVIPYYEKFLKLFPTAAALAKAPEQAVLKAWEGLGYYRRARFLHESAKAIAAAGRFPDTLEGIRELKGVGEYTAAAVGSIAFGLPAAVVDGNVIRVISRLCALDADPTSGEGAKAVREAAEALLDPRRPGDFNQAMMELGATVCTPDAPQCPVCPVQAHCAGFRTGEPEAYPKLPARPETVAVRKVALLVVAGKGRRAKVLAARREGSGREGDQGRMQGLWQFPELTLGKPPARRGPPLPKGGGPPGKRGAGTGGRESTDEAAALSLAKSLFKKRAPSIAGRLGLVKHQVTNHAIRIEVFWTRAGDERLAKEAKAWEWMELERLEKLPLAKAEKQMLEMIRMAVAAGEQQPALALKF